MLLCMTVETVVRRPTLWERVLGILALAAAAATLIIGVVGLFTAPIAIGLSFVAVALVTVGAVMFVTARGGRRALGVVLAVLAVGFWVWALLEGDALRFVVGMIVAYGIAVVSAFRVLLPHAYQPPAQSSPPPAKAFILMNPRSGGGKVEKFGLDTKAEEMGAQVALLVPGVDVVETVQAAVRAGADLLGAAGGDGTQALVASIAAEHGLPMLCVPAGTRNHFAMDLGLDRADPSRTLDALGAEGEEIVIDLGDVGGRPFVNNVSLGAYAEIVARPEYRDAKVETALDVLPEVTAPDARSGLTVTAPGRDPIEDPQVVQVANNPYARPEDPAPISTRPRLDTGELGVQVVADRSPAELGKVAAAATRGTLERADAFVSWTGPSVTITSADGTVHAGVDGEYLEFPSPLEIAIRPGVLRVRVPGDRPGPKRAWPQLNRRIVQRIWAIVTAR
jgi:diacylglycerol kinase family enzyme